MTKVSVIIPTYHDWERLKICIDALSKQTFPQDKFEVIIVNNDPKESPPELSLPDNFRIISEEKPGSYAARNAGIKNADGEILAFTDADCIPDVNWLDCGAKAMQKKEYISRVGGKIELIYKFLPDSFNLVEIYEKVFAFKQKQHVKESGAAVTANMFAKSYIFKVVGLFDETVFSGEDIGWGIRSNAKGYNIQYCEDSIVYHPARNKFRDLLKKAKRVSGGKKKLKSERINDFTITVIKGLSPPIFIALKILKNHNYRFYEKILSLIVHYFLKLYSTLFLLFNKFGIADKQRE